MRKVIIFSVLILVSTLLIPRDSKQGDRGISDTVRAADGWQNSGVYLRAGEVFTVSARGRWVSGYGYEWYGPEGWGYGTINNDALVGWISETCPARLGYGSYQKNIITRVILIGRGGTFKTYGNGYLYLAMGEWSGCHECRGEVRVRVFK